MLVRYYSLVCRMASMLTILVCSVFSHHQILGVGGRIYYRLTFREMLGGRRRSGFHHCVGQQSGLHLHLHLQSCHYNNHIFTHISSPSTNNSATPFKCYVVLSKYLSDQSHPLKSQCTILKTGNLMPVLVFSNNVSAKSTTVSQRAQCNISKRPFAGLARSWGIGAKFDLSHLSVQMCLP